MILDEAEERTTRSAMQQTRVFRRGFVETFALDLAARVLSAASVVVLIRGLDVSAYAFVTLFLIFAQFLASAAGGGVRLRYLRYEAERISRGDHRSAASFVTSLLSSSVLIAAVALAFLPIVHFFVEVPASGTATALVAYSIGFGIGSGAIELAIAHYQSRKRFVLAGVIGVVRAAAVLATSIIVVAEGATRPPALPLWFVGGMVSIGALATGAILQHRDTRRIERPQRERLILTSEEGLLTLYFLAAAGFAYVDVIVASMFLSATGIATLGATLRYFAVALAAIPAIGAVLRVRVSQIDVLDSPQNQRRLVVSWLRTTALPSAIVLTIGIATTPVLIPLIDNGRYPGSIIAFQILLPSAVLAYVTEPGPNILMAQNRGGTLAMLFGLALTVNFIGDVVVAPRWGVTAIAAVSSACFIGVRVAVTLFALRAAARQVVTTDTS